MLMDCTPKSRKVKLTGLGSACVNIQIHVISRVYKKDKRVSI